MIKTGATIQAPSAQVRPLHADGFIAPWEMIYCRRARVHIVRGGRKRLLVRNGH